MQLSCYSAPSSLVQYCTWHGSVHARTVQWKASHACPRVHTHTHSRAPHHTEAVGETQSAWLGQLSCEVLYADWTYADPFWFFFLLCWPPHWCLFVSLVCAECCQRGGGGCLYCVWNNLCCACVFNMCVTEVTNINWPYANSCIHTEIYTHLLRTKTCIYNSPI